MKLDSSLKRAGLALVIFSICVFFIIAILRIFAEPQMVAYHMQNGETIWLRRGVMDNMVLHWIETGLIIFPLLACGVVLLLGKGGDLLRWIAHGPRKTDDADNSAEDK